MAYTEAALRSSIETLEGALARGELRVDFADRSVTYRSTEEIKSSISYFQDLLTKLLGNARKQSFGVTSKGL